MKKAILYLCILATLLRALCACATPNLKGSSSTSISSISTTVTEQGKQNGSTDKPLEAMNQGLSAKNIIDDIIFLGESTTYHLKSRGVLSDGKETKQVWAPKSGTLMLDMTICDCRIIYPESNEEISLQDALKLKQPKIIMLTFGLNGATSFISRGENYFKLCYEKLLNLIKECSPSTKIVINSCFPVARSMDMSRYTIDAKQLNSYIRTLNLWAVQIASNNGAWFTDSASVLSDNDGFLKANLHTEDGYHLNSEAYTLLLSYWEKELKILQAKEN